MSVTSINESICSSSPFSSSSSYSWAKSVKITKDSPGRVDVPEEFRKQYEEAQVLDQEARARFDEQRLSSKQGVQTDGTLYWLNGKGERSLVGVEDYSGYTYSVENPEGRAAQSCCIDSFMRECEIATTSKNGTRVSVQSLPTAYGLSSQFAVDFVKLLNIETKQGLQLQMELNQNVRITDQEDGGVSLYFPDTGETKIFDAKGKLHVEQGDVSGTLQGTAQDDILINMDKARVDGGDGDDYIFNFSDNTVIDAGDGDDTVLLVGQRKNIIANTGNGEDAVYGNQAQNVIISSSGNVTIGAQKLTNTNINADKNLDVKISQFVDGNIQISGTLKADIGWVLNSSIDVKSEPTKSTLHEENNINIGGLSSSSLVTGNGDNAINIGGLSSSSLKTGNGNDKLNIDHIYKSQIETSGGDDLLTTNHIGNSYVNMGDGNDILINIGMSYSCVDMGSGDDIIVTDSAGGSEIITGDGNDSVYCRTLNRVDIDIDTSKDGIYSATIQGIYRLRKDQSQESWDKMQNIAHRYDRTGYFSGNRGGIASIILGAITIDSR